MKSNIGLLQEELPSGKIATSTMRVLSFLCAMGFAWYLYVANNSYEDHFATFVRLVTEKVLTQESFNANILQLKRFEEWIVGAFLVGIFAPKAIQKYIENKAGVKTIETSSSESSKTVTQ